MSLPDHGCANESISTRASDDTALLAWIAESVRQHAPVILGNVVSFEGEGRVLLPELNGSARVGWVDLPKRLLVSPNAGQQDVYFDLPACPGLVLRVVNFSLAGTHTAHCAFKNRVALRVVSPEAGATIVVAPDADQRTPADEPRFERLSNTQTEADFEVAPDVRFSVSCHFANGFPWSRSIRSTRAEAPPVIRCERRSAADTLRLTVNYPNLRLQVDGTWVAVRRVLGKQPNAGEDPSAETMEPGKRYWLPLPNGTHVVTGFAPGIREPFRQVVVVDGTVELEEVDVWVEGLLPSELITATNITQEAPAPPARPRQTWVRALAIGGVAVAVAGGVIWGVAGQRQDRAQRALADGDLSFTQANRESNAAERWRDAGMTGVAVGSLIGFSALTTLFLFN